MSEYIRYDIVLKSNRYLSEIDVRMTNNDGIMHARLLDKRIGDDNITNPSNI